MKIINFKHIGKGIMFFTYTHNNKNGECFYDLIEETIIENNYNEEKEDIYEVIHSYIRKYFGYDVVIIDYKQKKYTETEIDRTLKEFKVQ